MSAWEFAQLEINNDERTQSPVKQQQVHSKPLMTDAQPLLPADERKVVTQLQQEVLRKRKSAGVVRDSYICTTRPGFNLYWGGLDCYESVRGCER